VQGLLIAITCLGMAIVAEVAAIGWHVAKELLWLRSVLIPWMDSIHNEIQGKK